MKASDIARLWVDFEDVVEDVLRDLVSTEKEKPDDELLHLQAKLLVRQARRLADIGAIEERQQNALRLEMRRAAIAAAARRRVYRG